MTGLLLKIIINASAILVASRIISGIRVDNTLTLLGAGLTLGLINAIVRPVLLVLTLPLTLVTLGLFIFILNAICLALTAWFVPGFEVDNLWAALLGALSVSVVSWIPNIFVSSRSHNILLDSLEPNYSSRA